MATKVIRRNANIANLNSNISEETMFFVGNDENKDFVMDISAKNTSTILNELTDLSSNPGAYAIREAYSNAYDAVMATGDMTRLIEVTVPDAKEFDEKSLAYKLHISECPMGLVRYATVTDHGIGMSTDDLRRFFTQYGGTKKQGAGLIGSKGLGSKAPLAVADFFDVITIKDGIRSVAHLWRGNGHNYAKIVKVEQTTEGNGTTVRIPIVDPKIATEMHECMTSITKWNLDANLTYNGEHYEAFLNEGISNDGKSGYVFLGNVKIGVDEDGSDVRVRMWQNVQSFPRRLQGHETYGNNFMRWNMLVDLNLCGVRYELTNPSRYGDNAGMPDIIVAGDPGYLNFTPSRDEVKDDDAKKEFLEAVSEADYDCDAVTETMFGGDYATVAHIMFEHNGFIREDFNGKELVVRGKVVGAVAGDALTSFDGTDMSDYMVFRRHQDLVPVSDSRYFSITKLSHQGYFIPIRHMGDTGVNVGEVAYSYGRDGIFTSRDIATRMSEVTALPLVAIIPSPMMRASGTSGCWGNNSIACNRILNGGNNHAILVKGPRPSWTEFQNREAAVRRVVAAQAGQDMKEMSATYLFADGQEPTKQDMLALGAFAHLTVTTWDEIVKQIRAANRATKVAGQATTAQKMTHIGQLSTSSYDLYSRRNHRGHLTQFSSTLDALLGDRTYAKNVTIDFDNGDLSEYVFAIGDGGNPATVARIASAMAMAGLLGEAKTLCFLSSTASATTSYALNMNEVKALVKNRGLKVLADLRYNRSHFPGIVDGIDGIDLKVDGNGSGSYRVISNISLDTLGITDASYENLSYIIRQNSKFHSIGQFVMNCRTILGTTFCNDLDATLDAQSDDWWSNSFSYNYFHSSYGNVADMSIATPQDWGAVMKAITDAIDVFHEISQINGVQSLVNEASYEDGALAKSLIILGLQAIVQQRIA